MRGYFRVRYGLGEQIVYVTEATKKPGLYRGYRWQERSKRWSMKKNIEGSLLIAEATDEDKRRKGLIVGRLPQDSK